MYVVAGRNDDEDGVGHPLDHLGDQVPGNPAVQAGADKLMDHVSLF
ncbi:hypothetical protein [Microbispora bryophytorum]|uniref:Uncharacterized protein n=1 Tax=Microbispora bryophytorum subsp. camponoti TaxID=1677852 RepID=A0ABR8L114_9ACTN|nr:hypothetical protein [Microbispora camponoti]MBD3143170.1 hypothetical protein [Microbispora camponoti]